MKHDMKYVALLRGINVGGKNMLPMKVLAEMFAEAGCTGVLTYIQSGNVVFSAPPAVLKQLAARITDRIAESVGIRVPVILRSGHQLAGIVQANPFLQAGEPPNTLHVYFLAHAPKAAAIESLDQNRSTPDRFHVSGSEIYLHLPNGMGRTKLTNAYFDSKLSTTSTARNWATLLKLVELTQG